MGMSASQVRFLSLQHRKHNIGRQLSALSNRKMALSRDMQQVSRNYTNALNQINLKFSTNCGGNTYDLTYDMLMKPNALNAETPYIVTDREGRVVVDDNEITYEKNGATVHTGVSYRQLAELISAYSGVDEDGNVLYQNYQNLANLQGELIAVNGRVNSSATSGIACSIEDGYKICVKSSDCDMNAFMRYDILNRLGIVTDDEYSSFTSVQKSLYGTRDAMINQTYKDIAVNDKIGTAEYYNAQLALKAENNLHAEETNYVKKAETSAVFGKIAVSDAGDLKFEGGSTMGNLELAKMYLKEYEDLYLNTTVKQAAMPSNWTWTNNYKTDLHDYEYDKYLSGDADPAEGVTNRIMDLLTNTNQFVADGVDSNGIYKEGVNLFSSSGTFSLQSLFAGNAQISGNSANGAANNHDYEGGSDSGITNYTGMWTYNDDWGQISRIYQRDNNAGNTTWNLSNFYDSGNQYPDVYAFIADYYTEEDSNYNSDAGALTCNVGNLYSLVDGIKNSVTKINQGNLDSGLVSEAADFAKYMTICKFMNNYRIVTTNKSGSDATTLTGKIKDNIEWSKNNPCYYDNDRDCWDESHEDYTVFAQSWEFDNTSVNLEGRSLAHNHWWDNGKMYSSNGVSSETSDAEEYLYFAVNLANLANTFVTFYTAFIEANVDRDCSDGYIEPTVIWKDEGGGLHRNDGTTGIVNGGTTVYNQHNLAVTSLFQNPITYPNTCDSVKYVDENGKSEYVFKDDDNNGMDDKTGLAKSLFKAIAYEDNGSGKDKTYNISQKTFNYLKNYAIDMKLDSRGKEVPDYKINDKYKNGDKKAEDSSIISELDALVTTDADGNSDYSKINKIFKDLQKNELVYKLTDTTPQSKYVEYVQTKVGADYVATAVTRTGKAGKMVSYDVTYDYSRNPNSGEILKYSETYDENGINWTAKTTKYFAGSGNGPIDNVYTGNLGGAQDEILACQIESGKDTYVIGRAAGYDTKYCNYMYTGVVDTANYVTKLKNLIAGLEEKAADELRQISTTFDNIENKTMEYFDTLFKRISENGWVYDEKVNHEDNQKASAQYLNSMLQNNMYFVTEAKEINENGKYQFAMKQATSVNKIYQVHDEDAENAAFAVYESEKTAINTKERQIDARMTKLETEQEAINTELESIKKVRNDNIEKYFKIFA